MISLAPKENERLVESKSLEACMIIVVVSAEFEITAC